MASGVIQYSPVLHSMLPSSGLFPRSQASWSKVASASDQTATNPTAAMQASAESLRCQSWPEGAIGPQSAGGRRAARRGAPAGFPLRPLTLWLLAGPSSRAARFRSGITLSRPSTDRVRNQFQKRQQGMDEVVRVEIEGKFGVSKRKYSLGRIMAKLARSSETVIGIRVPGYGPGEGAQDSLFALRSLAEYTVQTGGGEKRVTPRRRPTRCLRACPARRTRPRCKRCAPPSRY